MKELKSLEILLVEDEPQIQENYKEVLGYFFHTVHTASNGKEALDIYNNENISAIFTDYEMPVMDGYELVKKIRDENEQTPITIISNHDEKEKLQKCIPLGLLGYLFKPLSYEEIKNYLSENSKKLCENISSEYIFSQKIKVNFSTHSLIIDDEKLIMTKLESAFLKLMSQNENKVVSYDMIFDDLDEFDASFSTIKNLVYRLKTKYQLDFIKNIKDVGYILVKNA